MLRINNAIDGGSTFDCIKTDALRLSCMAKKERVEVAVKRKKEKRGKLLKNIWLHHLPVLVKFCISKSFLTPAHRSSGGMQTAAPTVGNLSHGKKANYIGEANALALWRDEIQTASVKQTISAT